MSIGVTKDYKLKVKNLHKKVTTLGSDCFAQLITFTKVERSSSKYQFTIYS
jgi:hypothetical protein